MVAKLRAIGRLITSPTFALVTVRKKGIKTISGNRDMETSIVLATSLKTAYDELKQRVDEEAIEKGELHALQALRGAIDRME